MPKHLGKMNNNSIYTRRMQLLFLALVGAIALLFLHYFGMMYYLYHLYWWFDILVHFLGGATVGLTALLALKQRHHFLVPIFVLCVIAGWELFEIFIVRISLKNVAQYSVDTAIDVFVGALGAYIMYLLYKRLLR